MAKSTILYAAMAAPVNAAFSTATTGGTLAAGTYSYRVSALDGSGGETLASSSTSLTIAGPLATPVNSAFTTATTGGTLAAGTYSYRVAAKNSIGRTLASTATTITTTGTTSTVTVNWGAVSGATGYDVFGRVGGSEQLMASVGAVTTWTDDGSITPSGALPTSNTTATDTNTVTVNWNKVTGATGYKVYGRTASGEQLMATLGDVATWTDTGSVTPSGALPSANTTGKGAATSTDIVLANGATAIVSLLGAAGAYLPEGVPFAVMQDTSSGDNLIAHLDNRTRSTELRGPATYRVKRPALTGDAFGVELDT